MKAIPIAAAGDEVFLRRVDVIYKPKGQAGEYSEYATNPYDGCGNRCKYCYVPLVRHITRQKFDASADSRKDYLKRLQADTLRYRAAGVFPQVLLSFTTDPYHPFDTTLTRLTLLDLRDKGLAFCTLTKGGTRALRDLGLFRPDRDAFATSLTSLDASFQRKWEPGAADPDDRLRALRRFHERGIFTWVSLEPTLDVEASLAIVRETHGYVDLFKIGRANYCGEITRETDWKAYTLRMVDLCQRLGVKHYIKKDLQGFLPEGYPNALRVQQHH